jgi:hypothetical protein
LGLHRARGTVAFDIQTTSLVAVIGVAEPEAQSTVD